MSFIFYLTFGFDAKRWASWSFTIYHLPRDGYVTLLLESLFPMYLTVISVPFKLAQTYLPPLFFVAFCAVLRIFPCSVCPFCLGCSLQSFFFFFYLTPCIATRKFLVKQPRAILIIRDTLWCHCWPHCNLIKICFVLPVAMVLLPNFYHLIKRGFSLCHPSFLFWDKLSPRYWFLTPFSFDTLS